MNELERKLLDGFQRDLPLSSTPFRDMAQQIGSTERDVIETLRKLKAQGCISRVGPVFRPHRVGASTLAAMAVPPQRLEEVAALVSAYPEVNHNYEREHAFNLWFVVTAPEQGRVKAVLRDIQRATGIPVMTLPLLEDYHIDLGFPLWP